MSASFVLFSYLRESNKPFLTWAWDKWKHNLVHKKASENISELWPMNSPVDFLHLSFFACSAWAFPQVSSAKWQNVIFPVPWTTVMICNNWACCQLHHTDRICWLCVLCKAPVDTVFLRPVVLTFCRLSGGSCWVVVSGCSLGSGLGAGQSAHFSILFSSSAWLHTSSLPGPLGWIFQYYSKFPELSHLWISLAFRVCIIKQYLVALWYFPVFCFDLQGSHVM